MAQGIIQNDVFKFMALRPPTKPKRDICRANRISDPRPLNETPVGEIIHSFGDGANIQKVLPYLKQLISDKKWSPEIGSYQEAAPIAAVVQVLDEHLGDSSPQDLDRLVNAALGTSPKEFFRTGQGKIVGEGLWDRLLAFYLLNRENPINYEELIAGLRALNVVEMMAEGVMICPEPPPLDWVESATLNSPKRTPAESASGIASGAPASETVAFKFANWGFYEGQKPNPSDIFASYSDRQIPPNPETNIPFLFDSSADRSLLANNRASKILLNSNDARSISQGSSLGLEEGYSLSVKSIKVVSIVVEKSPREDVVVVTLDLLKDGRIVVGESDKDVSFPTRTKPTMANKTYFYRKSINGAQSGIVTIAVHFKDAAAGVGTAPGHATVDGIWQISETPLIVVDDPTPSPLPLAPDATDLRAAFNATVLLPENIVKITPVKPAESPRTQEQQERDAAERNRLAGLWSKYVELNKAAEQLQDLQPEIEIRQSEPVAKMANIAQEAQIPKAEDEQQVLIPHVAEYQSLPRISSESLSSLSTAARNALIQTGGSEPGFFSKIEALDRIHRELAFVTDQLFSISDPRIAEVMPTEAVQLPGAKTLKARNNYVPNLGFNDLPTGFPYPWLTKPKIRPLGIGELKVVKQTLERYVAGEVAHIENVLKGESKERKHRRFDRTEETITIALETTEETERDTQTTDRFELRKEAEKTIQTDMSVDAGVTVSASYGPVKLGAHANFAYSQSTTDTIKTSSNFARDVVDRSVSRIQKKAREERVTRTIQEVEEINTHGLNNVSGPGHITGVYRWVDKHYRSQVYRYGKRMMFEFILPEPAAFFIYSQNNNPAKDINVEKPEPLGDITHKDITEWNYQKYIRDYNVQGITPPPPFSHILSIALDQSGLQEKQSSSKSSRDLVVPDGYVAKSWWGKWSWRYWDPSDFDIIVGATSTNNLSAEDMVVPIAIEAYNVMVYATVIDVYCERTDRHYEDWQIKTFEKIMAAYQSAMAQYEDKLSAAEARQGVIITGQNPAINREIERTEMKKHCITMLTGERYQNFNAMSGSPPEIDLVDAAAEGRFIQFFEQAFEWEQMTYLFYPYFWGRKNNWVSISTTFDKDPMFTRFLQAGAARVVLPVHPAYNNAILYYLQTGDLWNGGDPPVIDDPLYIALYEELKDEQDDLGNAVPEGDPWKVVLPTTLVWLQPGPELPDFTQP